MTSTPKRVFVTGASGFVGTTVVEELVRRNIPVSTLVHRSPLQVDSDLVTTTTGSIFDPGTLREAIDGCDAVIHLVGIIFEKPSAGVTFKRMHVEATRLVLDAAKTVAVEKWHQMSANGAKAAAKSAYHRTKAEAEQLVKGSEIPWTIFRPSMIHGPRGEFMEQAASWARGSAVPWLFMPYFGKGTLGLGGSGLIQPIYVKDVARAFVDALSLPQTTGRIYNLAGPDKMTWPEMHAIISRTVRGKPKRAIPIPAWYAELLTRITPAAWLPFNRDQVQMAREDNNADITEFLADFDITPAGFEEALQSYADEL